MQDPLLVYQDRSITFKSEAGPSKTLLLIVNIDILAASVLCILWLSIGGW